MPARTLCNPDNFFDVSASFSELVDDYLSVAPVEMKSRARSTLNVQSLVNFVFEEPPPSPLVVEDIWMPEETWIEPPSPNTIDYDHPSLMNHPDGYLSCFYIPPSPPPPACPSSVFSLETFDRQSAEEGPSLALVPELGYTLVADRSYQRGELVVEFGAVWAVKKSGGKQEMSDFEHSYDHHGWLYQGPSDPETLGRRKLGAFVNWISCANRSELPFVNVSFENDVRRREATLGTERAHLEKTQPDRAPRAFFVATRPIHKGEQLLARCSAQKWDKIIKLKQRKDPEWEPSNISEWTATHSRSLQHFK